MNLLVEAYGKSDIGQVRQKNEDVFRILPDSRFFIVADGMGGHRAGDVAAREAADALARRMQTFYEINGPDLSLDEAKEALAEAIQLANQHVWSLGTAHEEYEGMGTTLCCLWILPVGVVYAHVGDSRIYRLRNGVVDQLTQDHSLLARMLEIGKNNGAMCNRHVITRAIGTEPFVEPCIVSTPVQPGDCYLLCTDGLSDLLSEETIARIILSSRSLEEAVDRMIAHANSRGGRDNITALLAKLIP